MTKLNIQRGAHTTKEWLKLVLLPKSLHCTNIPFDRALIFLHNSTNVWHFRDERMKQVRWRTSENNDDITALQYHPSKDVQLLSGGDDGLVSVFDTSIQDDNDSLLQTFSHGPIHKAGFLSDSPDPAIYALSCDQKFSVYPADSFAVTGSEVKRPDVFGDLRPKLQCDYVIDVFREHGQPYIVTGSHIM